MFFWDVGTYLRDKGGDCQLKRALGLLLAQGIEPAIQKVRRCLDQLWLSLGPEGSATSRRRVS